MAEKQIGSTSKGRGFLLSAFLILATAVFVSLGIWQVERLGWKEDLIARVDARVHAEPVPAPGVQDWPRINAGDDEYRHVQLSGQFDHSKETLVYASTVLGPGYWVLTPLESGGQITLINRGFVPLDRKDPSTRKAGQIEGTVQVTGLLRIAEPKGTLLRSNDVAADRWYSRDVQAIAAKRGLAAGRVAPYFIDADRSDIPGGYPVGGLTQVQFPNHHLQYALTWFAMAIMSIGFLVFLWKGRGIRQS
ncbi:SURF1 family protein [Rhizobium paknamense]|uniref:SURF1-like protein n=1 Tax=Rhizobium paknamense TaxID=1206817 RepID=A0ABU0IDU1_9HYPH|nr:SURF1 family protein [Rhizobium paknamense]MDQ0456418.1 surfeit locus 1 family protein [Rhizobium paknamense]